MAVLLGLALRWMGIRENFEEADNSTPVDMADTSFITKLTSIPTQVKNTIIPSLDKLVANVKGESADSSGDVMSAVMYEQDQDADFMTNGNFDQEKYKSMVVDYKNIDKLLQSLKAYAPLVYNKLIDGASPPE
jgi:hypothetical protein